MSKAGALRRIYESAKETLGSEVPLEVLSDTVFTNWHTAFIAKAHGGEDEFGESWEPLAESTKKKKRGKSMGEQVRRDWYDRANQLQAQLVASGMTRQEAADKAAGMAWDDPTDVLINIDTTRLESSLSPEGHPDQIRQDVGGAVQMGTSVPYAKYVNGARRFQPTASELATWVRTGALQLRNVMALRLKYDLQNEPDVKSVS